MNNKVKNFIFCLFTFFLFSLNCYAYDYVIDNYDVVINVGENNKLSIKETIDVNFNTYKHGIIRNVPKVNTIYREDGTKEKNKVLISNVDVNEEFEKSNVDGDLRIKIGSASSTIIGKKEYIISYDYFLGNDKSKDYDELYFNIIGTEWDTVIRNVTFKIEMPKEFDASLLGFTHGKYLSSNTDNIDYEIVDNQIIGSFMGELSPGEALTVRLQLPEGYFVKDSLMNHLFELILYLLPIIFVFIAYNLWSKYGKDYDVIETVEFYPPEGLNSIDVAYIYKGNVSSKDVVSLLIHLANKGYLKIETTEKKSLFGKSDDFVITKLKGYDGDNKEEEKFLNGLFKDSDIVRKKDLEEKFYTTINSICYSKNSSRNKYKIFDKAADNKRGLLFLMLFLVSFLSLAIPVFGYGFDYIISSLLISFVFVLVLIIISAVCDKIGNKLSIVISLIFALISFMIAGIIFDSLIGYSIIFGDSVYSFGYLISLVNVIFIFLFYLIMSKRTEYGTEMLGKVRGFRNFLLVAEKDKLEALVNENPNYFYDILPYTYVLGVSDKWIKQFESIAIEPPTWYGGVDTRDLIIINHTIDRMMDTATRSMTSQPQSSGNSFGGSGGGFSGGGFSGGGSGGGGGSSW